MPTMEEIRERGWEMFPVPTRGLATVMAENVVRSAFEDAHIPVRLIEHDEEGGTIEVYFDQEDFDEATFAIPKARDQIAARAQFSRENPPEAVAAQKRTVVVNMFGGPGAGKTTAAFEVAEKLKKAGYVVEYAPEYAKELVWTMGDESAEPAARALARALLDGEYKHQEQLYLNQLSRIRRCVGQCDFVVTDSPIALSALYLKPRNDAQLKRFEKRVLEDMGDFTNFNLVIKRDGEYEQAGRVQDAAEAAEIDGKITDFLKRNKLYYGTYNHEQIDLAIKNMVKTFSRVNEREEPKAMTGEIPLEKTEAIEKGAIMAEANEKVNDNWMSISIPKTGYQGRPSIREFTGKDGSPYIQVKLPPHVPEVPTPEGPVDVSNHTFIVRGGDVNPADGKQLPAAIKSREDGSVIGTRRGAVAEFNKDPNYYSVDFPKVNKDGEPWHVNLQLRQGHYENPAGTTPAERGEWIETEPIKVSVEASQLGEAMHAYREDRREYKVEQYNQRKEKRLDQSKNRNQAPDKGAAQSPASFEKDVEAAKNSARSQAQAAPKQTLAQSR